jgi:putative hemolysin
MHRKMGALFAMVVLLAQAVAGCQQQEEEISGLPNPASVYCEEQGGTLEIREDENGQYGVCLFDDGSECDEWAYYRGECAPGQTSQVPEPTAAPAYVNAAYGFSFNPDSGYALEERDHQVLFMRDGYTLAVGYRTPDEEVEPLEPVTFTGSYEEAGAVTVLGVQVPRQRLIDGGKVKLVAYAPFQAGVLQVFMRLWVESKDQDPVDIPADIQTWADSIVETFALTSGETPQVLILIGASSTPDTSGWATYTLDAYGFSFRYPADWTIDDSIMNSINLTKDGYMLHIGYRWPGEKIPLAGTGTPAGDLIARAPVMVLSQPLGSQALVYEGRTVAVFYEFVMTPQVEIGFRGDLLGAQPDHISDDVLAQFDQIVMTLTLLPQGG